MSTTRTRTSLGRTSLSLDLNLPPSPERNITQQGSAVPSLSELMRRQTPRAQSVAFTSPVIPDIGEMEGQYEEEELITSVPDLVRSRSLDEELARTGYTPLSKMIVVSPSGEQSVRYIKAQNQLGEPLYIAVDVNDAFVSQNNNDPRLRESRIPMNIGKEEKELAYSKAGMGVAGVALECKTGLCTIMHDEQMRAPREQNFVLIHTKKVEETLILASFPVVRMSEIRANPLACQKNIDQALRKMRNAALHNCVCNIETVKKKLEQVCQLFQQTLTCEENVVKEFSRTMNILEDSYDKCSKCPEKNECKLKEIIYNIEKRNTKFPALLESCKEIASLEQTLDEALCTLKDAKAKLDKKFRHLHCAYELKSKKRHHHKCAWEQQCTDDTDSSDEE